MSRIVFAWQLGANYGHLMTDLPIAERLRELGHDVSFVVADELVSAELLTPANFRFVAAPRQPRPPVSAPALVSYAEIMEASGFGDERSLATLIHEWSGLMASTRADVIVADHAPMAVLTARVLGIPTVILGTGFTVPPLIAPLPLIRPWETIEPGRLQRADSRVLDRINSYTARRGLSPFAHLFDMFAGLATLLTTFPELDPFGPRNHGTYLGPITGEAISTPMRWNDGTRERILAYLRPSVAKLGAVLTALEQTDAEVICIVPGATEELERHFESTSVKLVGRALPLSSLLPSANLVVSYGGAGLIASALTTGVPLLLVPENTEQMLGSMQVAKLGAGVVIGPRQGDRDVEPALRRILADHRFKQAARQFHRQHAEFNPHAAAAAAAALIAECA